MIASGISCADKQVSNKEQTKKVSYLDDDLSFIRHESSSIESNEQVASAEADYTDIPAITRKLLEAQRLNDLAQVKV